MKSMTGFGYGEYRDDKVGVLLDLKSYNNRYLDIKVTLNPPLSPLEPRIREFLSSRIKRGRVEIYIKLTLFEQGTEVIFDRGLALSYLKALNNLAEAAGLQDTLRLSHLLRCEGILQVEKDLDMDLFWTSISRHLEEVFESYETSRLSEGAGIGKDILKLMDVLEENLACIDEKKEELEIHIKSALRERFKELLGEGIDENRIYSETALLLMKFDIHEEVMRLKSHIESFRKTMKEGEGGIGKNLDFISQELNREINTIASKSMQLEIHQSVIQMKSTVEKIREQLRNVE